MDISVVYIIGLVGTVSSIVFAYLAFKKNEKDVNKEEGKNEGVLLSHIGYIKSSIERMEKKLDKVESQYSELLVRVAKVEENNISIEKRIDRHILDKTIHKKGD